MFPGLTQALTKLEELNVELGAIRAQLEITNALLAEIHKVPMRELSARRALLARWDSWE